MTATFVDMKTKTKSKKRSATVHAKVSSKAKERLRRMSNQSNTSMASLLDELILRAFDEMDEREVGPGVGTKWVKENAGILNGKLTQKDLEEDSLTGFYLRKYLKE